MAQKNKLQVVDNDSALQKFPLRKYRKCKIERLGERALGMTLSLIKAGNSYAQAAQVLSETFDKKIVGQDVERVMKINSEIMIRYRAHLEKGQMDRANMVMNEASVLVDDMDKLDVVFMRIEERAKNAITNKDLVSLSKAMTDLARTKSDMITTFKKLTGQFKEGSLVNIDNSRKELHIHSDNPELSSRLGKELARAVQPSKTIDTQIVNPEKKDG